MQQYNDGSFGNIEDSENLLKKLTDGSPESKKELDKTKAIYFGTKEQLGKIKDNNTKGAFGNSEEKDQKDMSVKDYLKDINYKINLIVKHFGITHIIGSKYNNNEKK